MVAIRFLDIVFSTSVDREGDKNEIATWHLFMAEEMNDVRS
jgi:hypothetical protein